MLPGGPTTYQGVGVGWENVNNTPFREFKTFSHEGGIRTPMVVHWPNGVANPGKITNQVGHLIDIMPTVLELAGVEFPKTFNGQTIIPCEGESLIDCLKGGPVKDRVLYWDFANHIAVRQGKWKLVALSARNQNWELYDIEKDPTELNDLFDLKNGHAMQMATAFDDCLKHVGAVALNKRTKKNKNDVEAAS